MAAVDAVQRRTRIPGGIILDGTLARIPEMYRCLGGLPVWPSVANVCLAHTGPLKQGPWSLGHRQPESIWPARDTVLCSSAWRRTKAQAKLAGLAESTWPVAETAPQRPLVIDEIRAEADVIVIAGGAGAARRLRTNPGVAVRGRRPAGRVYQWPGIGQLGLRPAVGQPVARRCLVGVVRTRAFYSAFEADVRGFFASSITSISHPHRNCDDSSRRSACAPSIATTSADLLSLGYLRITRSVSP